MIGGIIGLIIAALWIGAMVSIIGFLIHGILEDGRSRDEL